MANSTKGFAKTYVLMLAGTLLLSVPWVWFVDHDVKLLDIAVLTEMCLVTTSYVRWATR